MAHAEICPVCGGKGQLCAMNPLQTGATQVCHGCSGSGWVTIQDPAPFIPTVKGSVKRKKHEV
jgi:DnaJ-class molecular chaperone